MAIAMPDGPPSATEPEASVEVSDQITHDESPTVPDNIADLDSTPAAETDKSPHKTRSRLLLIGGAVLASAAALATLALPGLGDKSTESSEPAPAGTDQPVAADDKETTQEPFSFSNDVFSVELPGGFSLSQEPDGSEIVPKHVFSSDEQTVTIFSEPSPEKPIKESWLAAKEDGHTKTIQGALLPGMETAVSSVNGRVTFDIIETIPNADGNLNNTYWIFGDRKYVIEVSAEPGAEVWNYIDDIKTSFTPTNGETTELDEDLPERELGISTPESIEEAPDVGDLNGDSINNGATDYLIAAIRGEYDMTEQRPGTYDGAEYATLPDSFIDVDTASTHGEMTKAALQRLEVAYSTGDTSFLEELLKPGAELNDELVDSIAAAQQQTGTAYKFTMAEYSEDELPNGAGGLGADLGGEVLMHSVVIKDFYSGEVMPDSSPETKDLTLIVSPNGLNDDGSVQWRISSIGISNK